MKLRKWQSEEKMAIVLEGLKGQKSITEICREHRISQTLYYRWRDRFLEAGQKGLGTGNLDEAKALSSLIIPQWTGSSPTSNLPFMPNALLRPEFSSRNF